MLKTIFQAWNVEPRTWNFLSQEGGMGIGRFEDIEAWQEARVLVREVYELFQGCRDIGFRDQIQRAAVSVMSNIAEGFDRHSNKEFLHFLGISRGSLAEVRSLAYAALDIGYLPGEGFRTIEQRCAHLKGLINGFIHYLKRHQNK
jgi:four helix bundle protein